MHRVLQGILLVEMGMLSSSTFVFPFVLEKQFESYVLQVVLEESIGVYWQVSLVK